MGFRESIGPGKLSVGVGHGQGEGVTGNFRGGTRGTSGEESG